jgi:hypothetical protein
VFEHFILPFFLEEVLASLHSEDNLNVDLGICTHLFTSGYVENQVIRSELISKPILLLGAPLRRFLFEQALFYYKKKHDIRSIFKNLTL